VRAHDLFTTGGQAFEALTGAMGEGIDALVGKSNKGFGEIARDFLLMIAKMTATAAVSQVFQYLLKAAGIAFSGVSAASGPAGGYNAGIGEDGAGWIAPRAGGGPVSAGTPHGGESALSFRSMSGGQHRA
jgi:lambda family phage tail tape measure protein